MSRDPDDDDDIARLARKMSARGLSIHDVAEVIGSQLKKQRQEIIAHMERRFRCMELVENQPRDETRFKNLHRRVAMLESELRILKKGMRS